MVQDFVELKTPASTGKACTGDMRLTFAARLYPALELRWPQHLQFLPPIRTGPEDDRIQHFDPTLLPTDECSIVASKLNAHHHLWDDLADDDELGTSIADWCAGAEWTAANFGSPTLLQRRRWRSHADQLPDVMLGHRTLVKCISWRTC